MAPIHIQRDIQRVNHPAGIIGVVRFRVLSVLSVAVAAVVLTAVAASAATTTRAALKLVRMQPLVLTGSGFRSGERVRVTVQVGGEALTRRVTAGRLGLFRVAFGEDVVLDRCNSAFAARAVGARGSEARLKLPELLCPPN